MLNKEKTAFALGGLGGNNAYGAGFLQAAMEKNVEPELISCTSGQIYWVYKYLTVKDGSENLREELEASINNTETTHNPDLDLAILAVFGRRGIFEPAYPEFLIDLYKNTFHSSMKIAHDWSAGQKPFLLREFLSTIPARILTPAFPADFCKKISKAFNESKIGIAFNSYDPTNGLEYIHLNNAARELLKLKDSKRKHSYRVRTEYKEISEASVKAGLWLYQYGFDKKDQVLDGAYYRQIMLSELVIADRIYVVRPINSRWLGDLPKNYIGVEDLKLETAFNGTYVGERDKIDLINKLLKQGVIKEETVQEKGYHPIDLIEIEIKTQRGFFDYIFDKMSVFEEARAQARLKFDQIEEKVFV